MNNKHNFFDIASFTPPSKAVIRSIKNTLKKEHKIQYANNQSFHLIGRNTSNEIEKATEEIAKIFSVKPKNILYASNASESNYLAVRSAILYAKSKNIDFKDMEIVTTSVEHTSVIKSCEYAKTLGVKIHTIEVEQGTQITKDMILPLINENTILLTLQYIQGVSGVKNDISDISTSVKLKNENVIVHADCAQSAYYYSCNPFSLNVDMISLDGSKIYGTQGISLLIWSSRKSLVGLEGKKDVSNVKIGTLPLHLIMGMKTAILETEKNRKKDFDYVRDLQDYFLKSVKKEEELKDIIIFNKKISEINKIPEKKYTPHIIYLVIPNVNHSFLATLLSENGFYVSTGYACKGNLDEGLRISFASFHSKRDIKRLIAEIVKNIPLSKKS